MTDIEAPPRVSRWEFWLALASTAGVFIAISTSSLLRGLPAERTFSTGRLLGTVVVEVVLGVLWVPRLRRQGWRLRCTTRSPEPVDAVRAVGLFFGGLSGYWLLLVLLGAFAPEVLRSVAAVHLGGQASLVAVLLVSVVNPIAEEFLYLGFLVNLLRREGFMLAVGASVVVRLAIHLYQGPLGIVSMLPIGIVFAVYYWRTSRLWPIVVAHGLFDLVGLVSVLGAA